ncbi:outer membrane beta-barrel protein [Stygiobacter electus]|uniref:Outer membrane beta-barrel protein n=1 Tax=Stygiobacter electus TaxID=3032292 RepID=A0AAE3TDX7_9BACT|nr:outer membrane beta-barrel protein [Stygiobacter electus]MDF1611882.1 outer membrane beta-barrel protein [Stygiobacter electus]
MKKLIKAALFIYVLFISSVYAQNSFSIGLVGTRFENIGDGQKLTEIEVPFGYGIILGYNINKDFTVAFTGEYFKDDLKNNLGDETDLRTHLSAYFTPFDTNVIRPYFSSGIVYTYRNYNYRLNGIEETKNIFDARFGAGVDYNIIQNVYLNFDAGIYSDGLNIVGWSSSVGLRISPRFF